MIVRQLYFLLFVMLLSSILNTGCAAPRQNAQPSASTSGPPASHEYELVRERDFGVWRYSATRSKIDPLHAAVNYRHGSKSDLQAYVEANRAMAEQLEQSMREDEPVWVSITFREPLRSREQYEAQVLDRCQEIWA